MTDTSRFTNTNAVAVLIPPPVEPGDAPITMSTQITSMPAFENPPRGYVAKPAVLAVMLAKNAPITLILLPSVSLMSSAPPKTSIPVIMSTTFACSESFPTSLPCSFADSIPRSSRITRNPSPPSSISTHVTTLNHTLWVYIPTESPRPRTSKPPLLNAAIEWNTEYQTAVFTG